MQLQMADVKASFLNHSFKETVLKMKCCHRILCRQDVKSSVGVTNMECNSFAIELFRQVCQPIRRSQILQLSTFIEQMWRKVCKIAMQQVHENHAPYGSI
jgi:hypothetical protein